MSASKVMTNRPDQIYVVLDTMIIMEYTNFLDYPWHDHPELKGKNVILLFCRPIIRELDRNKDFHPRGNVKKRCRKAISWITDNLSNPNDGTVKIGDNLHALLDVSNYPSHTATRPDDMFIEYSKEYEPVSIITKDNTLKLMARQENISVFSPLDSHRLADNEHTEVQRLQEQIRILNSRMPKIKMSSLGTDFCPLALPIDDLAFQGETLYKFMNEFQERPSFDANFSFSYFRREEVREYEDNLFAVAENCLAIAKSLCQSPFVHLTIENIGTCPSSRIEVTISIPKNTKFLSLDKFEFPELPDRPRTILSPVFIPRYFDTGNQTSSTSPPEFVVNKNKAVIVVGSLPHHRSVQLPAFALIFDNIDNIKECGLSVELLVHELPEPLSFNFPIRIQPERESDQARINLVKSLLTDHFRFEDG